MRGNRYHKLPEKCCMHCEHSDLLKSGLKCRNDESLYFGSMMNKGDHCPEFKKGKADDK